MRSELKRRIEALERRGGDAGPMLIVIEPIAQDGSLPAVDAFISRETGERWERRPGEAMADFISRVESLVDAMPNRPLSIMLAPEEWPEPEPGEPWWSADDGEA